MRLDRYVLREILPPTLLSLALYVFLLFMNILFDVAREAIVNQVALGVILKLLYYQLPGLLVVSLPMSVLLGTLVGIGRLSSDQEMVAMQAAGVPFQRLFRPIALLGLACAGVCFYFVAVVAPEGAYLHHLVKREVYLSRYINAERLVPRVFHQSLPGLLLYYDAREEGTGAFRRVLLYERDPHGVEETITVARRGELTFDADSGRVHLYLEDGATHGRRFDAEPEAGYSVTTFQTFQESRDAPAFIQAFAGDLQRNQREMSLAELRAEMARARAEINPTVRRLRLGLSATNYHERFALPVAALVFALLGLPLGIVNRRGGKASGFALSLAVVLIYWVGYSVLRDMAETGRLPVILALWLPNVIFAFLALILGVRRARLRRTSSRRGLLSRAALAGRHALARRRRQRADRAAAGPQRHDRRPHRRQFPLLIDRYVTTNYIKVFLFVLLSVYMVYLLVEFRSLIQDMVDNKIGTEVLLKYLLFLIPRMTTNILPVACLVATLVGLGLMARTREDTAVKAAGVSVYRLLLPLMILTLALSGAGFFLQNEILPTTNRVAETLRDRIAGRTPRTLDPRHLWLMGNGNRLFHYESADAERGVLQGLSIYELDPSQFTIQTRSYAERAWFDGHDWRLSGGWLRTFHEGGSQVETYGQKTMDLGVTPAFFQSEDRSLLWGLQREPDQMSYRDQRAYIRQLARRGYDTRALRVALAQKLAFPVIPLFMVLLGFPFSFRVGARGSLFGVGLAIALTVLYWATLAVFNALGTAGLLPPQLSAWAPNIFFGGVGVYLTLHVKT